MPTFNDAAADAEQAQQAVRGLAHALRSMNDPSVGYDVIGSLRLMAASLEHVLDRLGDFHATTARKQATVDGNQVQGQDAAESVAEELRYAGRLIHQSHEALDRAQNIDGRITYRAATLESPHVPDRGVAPPAPPTHRDAGPTL